MCLVIVAYQVVEGFPIVVGANRDEAWARGGEPPCALRTCPVAWGGRDPVAGGTWLGVNEHGLLVAVTDRPAAAVDPTRRSRGLLCLDALGQRSAADVAGWLRAEVAARPYNPFNLVYADRESAGVACCEGSPRLTPLAAGVHVIAGGEVDDYGEPKIARAFELLGDLPREALAARARIANALADRCPRADERDQVCVLGERFGTLSSSVVGVGASFPAGSFYWHAAGPPCRASYEDMSQLFA